MMCEDIRIKIPALLPADHCSQWNRKLNLQSEKQPNEEDGTLPQRQATQQNQQRKQSIKCCVFRIW